MLVQADQLSLGQDPAAHCSQRPVPVCTRLDIKNCIERKHLEVVAMRWVYRWWAPGL